MREQGIEFELIPRLRDLGLTVATAESCTAGLIASTLVNSSGASKVLKEGFITYCDESKIERLGITKKILDSRTAVSEEVALLMAENVAKIARTDIGLSSTGFATFDPSDRFHKKLELYTLEYI